MGSNQQQTDLPQETSPNHVPGKQPFSRELLIALEGGEAARKQSDSPLSVESPVDSALQAHWPRPSHTQQQTAPLKPDHKRPKRVLG